MLAAIDKDTGIRVEPPPPGHLYYMAFLPDEKWREPAGTVYRLARVRVFVDPKRNRPHGTLTLPARTAYGRPAPGDAQPIEINITAPRQLQHALTMRRRGAVHGLLVCAPPTMTYGTLMSFLRPALTPCPTPFVFLE